MLFRDQKYGFRIRRFHVSVQPNGLRSGNEDFLIKQMQIVAVKIEHISHIAFQQ